MSELFKNDNLPILFCLIVSSFFVFGGVLMLIINIIAIKIARKELKEKNIRELSYIYQDESELDNERDKQIWRFC